MQIISFICRKGGTGKTSSTAAIGAGLYNAGKSVLYVDLDPQGNLTAQLTQTQPERTIYEIFSGSVNPNRILYPLGNGAILPSNASLADKTISLSKSATTRLKTAIETIRAGNQFNVCLIDCPPNLGNLTVAALCVSDYAIIPAKADLFSLKAIHETADTIRTVKETANPALQTMGILITQYNGRTTANQMMLEQISEHAKALNIPILHPPIRRAIAVEETQITGGTVYDSKNSAAEDYKKVTEHIAKELNL